MNILVKGIRDHINSWNEDAKTFTRTGIADEIPIKAGVVQTSVMKIVDNNPKQRNRDRGMLVLLCPDLYRLRPLRSVMTGWNALAQS
ncbi:hypothetical protein [Streptomyces phaeochromogenes]|uniref:hypothetical protein n=1 Tax=Streptomyces phaeochromogenes TaxID=1923 RepID=UPI00386C5ED1|nr:hypothetical protein OG277_49665 [Streptomyces phaeochromogenes]